MSSPSTVIQRIAITLVISSFLASAQSSAASHVATVDPVVATHYSGRQIHAFSGFGYHGTDLFAVLDLRNSKEVPPDYRDLYMISIQDFTKVKMPALVIQNCTPTADMQDFRERVGPQVKHLQERIMSSTTPLKIAFSKSVDENGYPIAIAEVDFSDVNIVAIGKTHSPKRDENSGMCAPVYGPGESSSKPITCESRSPYGTHHSTITIDLASGTVTDSQSGEVHILTDGADGSYYDDGHVGVRKLERLTLPRQSEGGIIPGSVVISGIPYTCR